MSLYLTAMRTAYAAEQVREVVEGAEEIARRWPRRFKFAPLPGPSAIERLDLDLDRFVGLTD